MGNGRPLTKWFPEIVSQFEQTWRTSLSSDDLIKLGKPLNSTLARIRNERNIIPPLYTCSGCGETHRTVHEKLSIQAIINAAIKYNLADENEVKLQYRNWMKYRKRNH